MVTSHRFADYGGSLSWGERSPSLWARLRRRLADRLAAELTDLYGLDTKEQR